MQFADIAINTKTASRDLFSYQIPAQQLPFIQEGSLVQVPFAGRKLLGVVFKLKKNLRKMEADQLKSIIKVVDPTPILDSNRLKLAQKIKDYYISPLGKVAFAMIPKPAYRLADKNQEKIINHPAPSHPPVLILGSQSFRLKKYQQIITRVRQKNRQILILLSGINSSLRKELEKGWPEAKIYHTHLTTTEKYRLWQEGQRGKIDILIGTRQALFLPLTNLSAIIIDDATSDLYKNDQEPFFDLRQVALDFSKINGGQLLYGSLNPPLELWPKAKTRSWPIIRERETDKNGKNIIAVNLSRERSILSQHLRERVGDNLEKGRKSLLFLNRRGKHRLAICLDCQYSKYLGAGQETINRCPQCQGKKIKLTLIGTRNLAQTIQEEFPQARLAILDSETLKNEQQQIIREKFDILISTTLISQYSLSFQLVGLILPEISLSFPSFDVWEKAFYQFSEIAALGKEIVIQSFNPSQPVVNQAVRNNFPAFYRSELKRRKDSGEPPFGTFIKLYSRQPEPIVELEQTRKKILSWAKKENVPLTITPIIEPTLFKWPYLLLKTNSTIPLKLKSKLAEFSRLKIDRDPKYLF
jgi:primosomal protein N' (replication factor Y) (superfamily II helicase)